jgi:hypothetical protein
MKTTMMALSMVALTLAVGCANSSSGDDQAPAASSDEALHSAPHASCLATVKQSAISRAEKVLNPNFPLNYIDTTSFGPDLYRVTLSDFGREVRVDVTVDGSCRILGISVDEDSDSN